MIVLAIYLLPLKLYRAIYRRKPGERGWRAAGRDQRVAGSFPFQSVRFQQDALNPNHLNNLRSSAKAYLSGLHLAELP
jgi:hypothetical protein